MSRFGPRHSSGDLAYGEEPQRWDRDRFERYRGGPPVEERETFRFTEHDRPGRQEIRIKDRVVERSPPRRRFEERDSREFTFAEDRYGPPARARRSDRDLFGDEDPRELANRQLAPYRRKSIVERDIDYRESSRGPPPRPGMLMRRQSSLDTYDRRPMRDEYRIPPGVPVPLPRRRSPSRGTQYYEEDYEDIRRRDYSPHDYRDVEIMREKTVRRRRAKSDARSARSSARSVARSSSSSSESSFEEKSQKSRHSSPERKVGKKGKTRMPKRLVRKQAVIDMGFDFEEEEDFIVVQRALDKDHIDKIIQISATFKSEPKTTTYRYDEPPSNEEHYEHLRTEWINPPSVRAPSPARSARTRRSSPARTVRQPSPQPPQQTTVYIRDPPQPAPPPAPIYIRESAPPPPPPPAPIYIREPAPPPPTQYPTTIVIPENRRREHSRDINAEIRALEAEAAAVRLERESHHGHRELIVRRPEETNYEMVEYRDRRPDREYEYAERAKSPKRDVVRVEKDRKGRMALVRSAR